MNDIIRLVLTLYLWFHVRRWPWRSSQENFPHRVSEHATAGYRLQPQAGDSAGAACAGLCRWTEYFYRVPKRGGHTARLPALATELVKLKVDLIVVAGGFGPLRATADATKTIPIIIAGGGLDPVEAGLIDSLARPGGNITGYINIAGYLGGKRLELLKEAVPKVARIAVLFQAKNPRNMFEFKEVLPASARALNLTIERQEVRDANDFDRAFAAISKERPDGISVLGGPLTNRTQERTAAFAIRSRLPSMYDTRDAVDAGGLMFYGADAMESYQRIAYYVDKILKGAKPADLPVEQPTKFELVINLKTAKQIGLTIPPNVLARADRVIR